MDIIENSVKTQFSNLQINSVSDIINHLPKIMEFVEKFKILSGDDKKKLVIDRHGAWFNVFNGYALSLIRCLGCPISVNN